MKNKFLTLVALIAIGFSSCKKEKVETVEFENSNSVNTTLTQINDLSSKYLNEHRGGADQDRLSDRWRRILSADCYGALGGMIAGSVVPGWGAIVGGILGGAGASLAAGISEGVGSGDVDHTSIYSADIELYNDITDNPFIQYGLLHYTYINDYLVMNDARVTRDLTDFYNFGTVELSGYLHTDLEDLRTYSLDNFNDNVTNSEYVGSFVEGLGTMLNERIISVSVYDLLIDYATVMEATDKRDLEDFVTYSITIENLIYADRSISDSNKELVLATMATARFGIQYWGMFFEE